MDHRRRLYYSTRTGKTANRRLDLPMLKRLFLALYWDIYNQDNLQELLGKDCVDDSDVFGTAGRDVHAFVLRRVRKDNLWPVPDRLSE